MRQTAVFPNKYLSYTFSTGSETGADYKTFERAYKRYLTALCKENNWQLTAFHKNHYEFSCFIRFRNRVVFLSIPDVRYWKNDWHSHILVRCAESEKDFRGGQNRYTDIPHLKQDIERLFASVSF